MKICIDIRSLTMPKTGVGYYTNNLINSILYLDQENEYNLFYYNFFNRKYEFDIDGNRVSSKEIKFIPQRVFNFVWRYIDFPKLDTIVGKMDLFHFPNFTMMPVKKGKVVITVHDLSFMRYPHFTEPKNLKLLKRLFVKSIHRADLIFADSEFTKRDIIDVYHIDENKIQTVYLGVDNKFNANITLSEIEKVKEKYFLPDKYIFYVGTLEPRKNIPALLNAYKLLKERNKGLPYKLVIVGMKGWLYNKIFQDIQKLQLENDIIFTGYVEDNDLHLIYSGGSLLVYPSFYEGFGFPVIEAMACGIPVVCSDKTSLPEVAGDASIFCSTDDYEEISIKIEQVLSDKQLKKEMVNKGFQQARKFTWEKTAKTVLSSYKELVQ